MKRAKIMLVAIAVLATVGGALAFKAQKFGDSKYCYLTTENQPAEGLCINTTQNRSARAWQTGDPVVFYTTTQDLTKCNKAICETTGIIDQQ